MSWQVVITTGYSWEADKTHIQGATTFDEAWDLAVAEMTRTAGWTQTSSKQDASWHIKGWRIALVGRGAPLPTGPETATIIIRQP